MSALMIARVTVEDPEKFTEYLAKTKEVATPCGAELFFQGKADRALTGDHDHGVVVIVKFPSVDQIDAWFGPDAYRPPAALRDQVADAHMTSYQVIIYNWQDLTYYEALRKQNKPKSGMTAPSAVTDRDYHSGGGSTYQLLQQF